MNRVWKFELEVTGRQTVKMPEYAEIIHVGMQNGKLCMWAVCNPVDQEISRSIYIFGTGQEVLKEAIGHIGTVMIPPFVWHVFEG